MGSTEVVATVVAILTAIGVPVGILWREVVRSKDSALAAQGAECVRALDTLREAHARELTDRDRLIDRIRADCDRERAEAVAVRDRLIEVALRSASVGEKAADAAQRAVGG